MDNDKKELIDFWLSSGVIRDDNIIEAFKAVDREDFILDGDKKEAYADYPLSIGYSQTISQPSTIMIMIQALELKKTDIVLEVGTGSGYNAALISKLCKKVYTTEIVPELAEFAKKNLEKADIKNIEVIETDGSKGYKKRAPYDKCIITAACPQIPAPIIEQMKVGGIVVAPVGGVFGQVMIKAVKTEKGVKTKELGNFMFVPLKGEFGY